VLSVEVDLADDRFDVRHDPGRIGASTLLATVRRLGYSPEIVEHGAARPAELERVDLALLPAGLQQLFATSRATRKPVLLDFFAPG
jgi:hypothetical protein